MKSDRVENQDASPQKDESREHPVPAIWRPTFREIVKSLVRDDYRLSDPIPGVDLVTDDTADQIREYISDYGETLVEIPEETWRTSVAQWMGTYWDVIVDLWTESEGRSDLILSVRVRESGGEFTYEVQSVYVP